MTKQGPTLTQIARAAGSCGDPFAVDPAIDPEYVDDARAIAQRAYAHWLAQYGLALAGEHTYYEDTHTLPEADVLRDEWDMLQMEIADAQCAVLGD